MNTNQTNQTNNTFNPSEYQENIASFIRKGSGHACVNARAGSGKTRTLEFVAQFVKGTGCYLVFNSANQKEAVPKFQKFPNFDVRTLHSAGFGAIRFSLKAQNCQVDDNKYTDLAQEAIDQAEDLTAEEEKLLGEIYAAKEISNIIRLARLDMSDFSEPSIFDVISHYEIEIEPKLFGFYCKLIPAIIEKGVAVASYSIDFTDMIYLPASQAIQPKKYDYIFVDECQDLSKAQVALVKKMLKRGSRALFVGDPQQAIYGFAGADCNSFKRIVDEMKAEVLPLSICYRCDENIIRKAQEIVPDIRTRSGADKGIVKTIKEEQMELLEGDMILCRTTAPLVELCFSLIAEGKPARIKGRDIGKNLVATTKKIVKQAGFTWDKFIDFSEQWKNKEIEAIIKMAKGKDVEARIQSVQDKVQCVNILVARNKVTHIKQFQAAVEDIFSDDRPGIQLSTVHRAKGLETDRVFIIRPDLLPGPWAKPGTWQYIQETNLVYVAYTRAKHELYFVQN